MGWFTFACLVGVFLSSAWCWRQSDRNKLTVTDVAIFAAWAMLLGFSAYVWLSRPQVKPPVPREITVYEGFLANEATVPPKA
jgi:hypothetical protein